MLSKKLHINTPTGSKQLTVLEAILLKLANNALEGNDASIRRVMNVADSVSAWEFKERNQFVQELDKRMHTVDSLHGAEELIEFSKILGNPAVTRYVEKRLEHYFRKDESAMDKLTQAVMFIAAQNKKERGEPTDDD